MKRSCCARADTTYVLVASDLRLLRTATAEGLAVLNPATDTAAIVAQIVAD